MTTIPNLNIVIQQGDAARESQNIRNQVLETAQQAAFQRLEEEDRKRTQVSQAEETEQILFTREKAREENRRQRQRESSQKKDQEARKKNVDPDAPGRLLNTIV